MRLTGASLAPLAERSFRLLWTGQVVSSLGDALLPVALAFAVLRVGGGATDLGLILAASVLARIVLLPVGGVWGDRLPRQWVMLASDVVRAAATLALAVLLIRGDARPWQLLVGSAVLGAASAFFQPAATGLVAQTASPARLQQANALMGLGRSATLVVGPVLSGGLVAGFGPGWIYAFDAATFVGSAVSLAAVRVPDVRVGGRAGFLSELAAGWTAAVRLPWYLLGISAAAIWNVAVSAFFVLGPVIASRSLGGAAAWGLVSASVAVGLVAGGVLALHWTPRRPLVVANLAVTPGALLPIALIRPFPLVIVAMASALAFLGAAFMNAVWAATMQRLIRADLLARVGSLDWLLSFAAQPVGYAIVGPLADRTGSGATLIAAALVMALPNTIVAFMPAVRAIDRSSSADDAARGRRLDRTRSRQ
ncbi:MAG TPA: MFS transporter [Candidatus Dormibacteraeota bacterium]|nr:MFS transporter [Candidatus Dormibacteraeota bacterium]